MTGLTAEAGKACRALHVCVYVCVYLMAGWLTLLCDTLAGSLNPCWVAVETVSRVHKQAGKCARVDYSCCCLLTDCMLFVMGALGCACVLYS